ncbi:hypothetical protein [Mycolicibacterium confluentis]|uniref:Uncharacterized protein n=1 Tax=Mycolicibacterium confluentis TaxID=28047 RepID=A0A7I7Y6Q5_9MYCO|nr:hypothetical protein [Mycolicibacterium confluentis]ORV28791.1 hypothetical protein AWB99_16900 [Mycolicibacterium confluentis]BBZ36561.1 hypothetical protein MCNF_51660 [Mycolicibacterium confluentis]
MLPAPHEPEPPTHQVTGAGRVPSHAGTPRTRTSRLRLAAALMGAAAAVAAVGFGTVALLRHPQDTPSAPTSLQHITVTPAVPLNDTEVLALLRQPPDYGALGDPGRRASCLTGLGYPAGTVALGARPVVVDGRPGLLLVLPGDTEDTVAAVAVAPYCSAADTGLLADRTVPRTPSTGGAG